MRILDILVIALCAVICGANDWQQIVTFGEAAQCMKRDGLVDARRRREIVAGRIIPLPA